jgi:DNA mismatch repair protein MutH
MKALPYDPKDPYSIESYARTLAGHSLREQLSDIKELGSLIKVKGSLGQTIEEHFFHYAPNNIAGPDFPEAGVELKTTPVTRDATRKFKAKERLVFNIINYLEEYDKEFTESSFWKKNNLLLLMFYLHKKEAIDIDLVFELIRLFRFPAIDLKIIKDDWEMIRSKIQAGKADELSEGDTFYLGACTKGANSSSMRKQPFSTTLAKQRAYSLKPKYLNLIIEATLKGEFDLTDQTSDYKKLLGPTAADPLARHSTVNHKGLLSPIVSSISAYQPGETIEDLVIRLFRPYYGHGEQQLFGELDVNVSNAKSRYYNLAKAILKVDGERIEEFEKADIQLKTIRLEHSGTLKESMSFPQIKYLEIISEDWEDSELYEQLTKKFFFVIFQKDADGEPQLKKAKFWNMPGDDLEMMQRLWADTRKKIINGDFDNFVKISDDKVGHVRPKALNAADTMRTHFGTDEKKKSFWLNSSYIRAIIN